eukprot:scaffold143265_cov33-Tisochrysis_lutea.AAC.3
MTTQVVVAEDDPLYRSEGTPACQHPKLPEDSLASSVVSHGRARSDTVGVKSPLHPLASPFSRIPSSRPALRLPTRPSSTSTPTKLSSRTPRTRPSRPSCEPLPRRGSSRRARQPARHHPAQPRSPGH